MIAKVSVAKLMALVFFFGRNLSRPENSYCPKRSEKWNEWAEQSRLGFIYPSNSPGALRSSIVTMPFERCEHSYIVGARHEAKQDQMLIVNGTRAPQWIWCFRPPSTRPLKGYIIHLASVYWINNYGACLSYMINAVKMINKVAILPSLVDGSLLKRCNNRYVAAW
jgi:hypothetical protein